MNPMNTAGPAPNSVFVVTSPNGYTVLPAGMTQGPLYPSYQPQVQVIHGNPLGSEAFVGQPPAQGTLKEGKALGAIQILIGLFHWGLGSIMGTVFVRGYLAISFYGGFPFWAGIWFIVSGSLSVTAEKQPRSSCLLNSSLGFNILSAIFSLVGICLFTAELVITPSFLRTDHHFSPLWNVVTGIVISSVLLIFSLLEFCIACASAHFGCQLVCYQPKTVGMVVPNIYVANPVANPEPENMPPDYSNIQGDK
ncbi:membrane-spanning 4-domains subfamily A member 8-like [Phacochoerus africanus]|uniref:membrane-spanning 4-domains subfamily A member 8-like n=1 Tax=Phacochoerus africanus TaxID=41426 RepID=UPI001FD8DE1A|nr:membrane-spanning 4-domains subfamily A member 8-like [Phacochoerus africanus]